MPDVHQFQEQNPDQFLYMHNHVIPDLKGMGVTDEQIHTLFVENPQRFFEGG